MHARERRYVVMHVHTLHTRLWSHCHNAHIWVLFNVQCFTVSTVQRRHWTSHRHVIAALVQLVDQHCAEDIMIRNWIQRAWLCSSEHVQPYCSWPRPCSYYVVFAKLKFSKLCCLLYFLVNNITDYMYFVPRKVSESKWPSQIKNAIEYLQNCQEV